MTQVKLVVTVSEPMKVPPLKEALYMEMDRQPNFVDASKTDSRKQSSAADRSNLLSPHAAVQNQPDLPQDPPNDEASDEKEDPDLQLIDRKIGEMRQEFDSEIKRSDQQIDEKVQTKNKKKK